MMSASARTVILLSIILLLPVSSLSQEEFLLTVSKVGTGGGIVSSVPSGIDCGGTCAASYAAGTGVTLSVAPDAMSVFTGWSGGQCAGTDVCVVTMDTDQTVNADFSYYTYYSMTENSHDESASFDVALGDLDGDGDLDAFIANSYAQPNQVWLNDGSGAFTDTGQLLGDSSSRSVSLGDVDGDGDLDAFVANAPYYSVDPSQYSDPNPSWVNLVWLNDGNGVFTDSGQGLGDSYSHGVSLGDLDGDGDLDAFVANGSWYGEPNLVWLNDGGGIFSDSGQSLGNYFSSDASLGDLDSDGDLDAFIANKHGPNRVWLNDGGGFFTYSGQTLGDGASNDVSLGDVDGDGDLDAFTANGGYFNEENRIWLNDGAGVFTVGGLEWFINPSNDVSLGDLDGDGDMDAFVANGGSPGKPNQVWLNSGDGFFTDSGQLVGYGYESWAVSLGDLDGDGDLDAFVANADHAEHSDRPNLVWLNDGSGSFYAGSNYLAPLQSEDIALGDLDGDGDLDAFVANGKHPSEYRGQPNRVWFNNGAGILTDSGQALGHNQSRNVALGDVDNDGDLDAYVANEGLNRVWLNNGAGIFTDSGQTNGNYSSWSVGLGDVDDDGDMDAFVANSNQNRLWLNNGAGIFTDSGRELGDFSGYDVALGDMDGDGDLDAFILGSGGNSVWLNDGGGNFTDSGPVLGGSGVTLGDVDGDGDLDALVTSIYENMVWLNDGDGFFANSGQSLGSSYSRDVSLGDLDGDGDLDAFVANGSSDQGEANQIWLNNGAGIFTNSGEDLGSSLSRAVSVGDVDGDGDLDVIVANNDSDPNAFMANPSQQNNIWFNQADSSGYMRLLSIHANPAEGGKVIGVTVDCEDNCTIALYNGTTLALEAVPADGFGFVSWTGCDSVGGSGSEICAVTADVDKSVTAGFNHNPAADGLSITTAEDVAKGITLTASDYESDPLTFSVVNPPAHGTLSGTVPDLTYTPYPDYHGPDSFTFKASDNYGQSAPAVVAITVTPVNDPPLIDGYPKECIKEGLPYSFIPEVLDPDDGDDHLFSILNKPAWAVFDTATGELSGIGNIGETSGIVISVQDIAGEQDALPSFDLLVSLEGCTDLVLDFGSDTGIWVNYNDDPFAWRQVHGSTCEIVKSGDLDASGIDEVIIDFGSGTGVWANYGDDPLVWAQIDTVTPELIEVGDLDGNNGKDVVLDFGSGSGVWVHYNNDPSSTRQIHPSDPEIIVIGDLDGNGQDDVVLDFGSGVGVWVNYNDDPLSWRRIHGTSPELMAVGDLDDNGQDDMVLDFGSGIGVWAHYNDDPVSWRLLHGISPELLVVGDLDDTGKDEVVFDFGSGIGIWAHYNDDPLSWRRIHSLSPELMAVGDLDGGFGHEVILDFGSAIGIWANYNDDPSSWRMIHSKSPTFITTGNLD